MTASANLKEKIASALAGGGFSGRGDLVDVSDSEDTGSIHVVVVSRKFDGMGMLEKQDAIWTILADGLDSEELERITLMVGVSPEDIKSVPA